MSPRPRCSDCDRATKNVYTREGADGTFRSLDAYRLCPSCERVLPLTETEDP